MSIYFPFPSSILFAVFVCLFVCLLLLLSFCSFQDCVRKNSILRMGACTSVPNDSDSSTSYRLALASKAKRFFLASPAKEQSLNEATPVDGFASKSPELGMLIESIHDLFCLILVKMYFYLQLMPTISLLLTGFWSLEGLVMLFWCSERSRFKLPEY